MNKIVVYYSLSGNTKMAAAEIAKKCDADILELKIKNPPTSKLKMFFMAGKGATLGELPELEQYEFISEKYDMIIFGTPIWAGKMSTPISSFIAHNNLENKKVAVFTSSGNGNDTKCIKKFSEQFKFFIESCNLVDRKNSKSSMNMKKINDFVNKIID